MMQLRALALAFATFTLSVPALALDLLGKAPSDSQILSEIHHKNQGEIALARLAENRSANDSVLGYARRIVEDHKKADQKAMDLAKRTKLVISPVSPKKEENQDQAKLSSLTGADFDKEFLKVMEKDHKDVISWLDGAQKQAKNTQVKQFISDFLPTLHQHQDLAATVQKKTESTG